MLEYEMVTLLFFWHLRVLLCLIALREYVSMVVQLLSMGLRASAAQVASKITWAAAWIPSPKWHRDLCRIAVLGYISAIWVHILILMCSHYLFKRLVESVVLLGVYCSSIRQLQCQILFHLKWLKYTNAPYWARKKVYSAVALHFVFNSRRLRVVFPSYSCYQCCITLLMTLLQ